MFNNTSTITRSMTALSIILATLAILTPNSSWAQILNRHPGLPIPGLESFTPAPDANFAGLDLTNADLREFNLSGVANFENSIIRGVAFGFVLDFSLAQLVSTASYQIRDLRDVSIGCADIENANFQSQNLENARFRSANLVQANFTDANLTDVDVFAGDDSRTELVPFERPAKTFERPAVPFDGTPKRCRDQIRAGVRLAMAASALSDRLGTSSKLRQS
jgi:hypothetical protein